MPMKWLAPGARDDRIFTGTISATQQAMAKTMNALWERVPRPGHIGLFELAGFAAIYFLSPPFYLGAFPEYVEVHALDV